MSINILKATDPVEIKSLVGLIYGQPGWGKTSTLFTGNNVIVFDFDRGAHRSAFRQDSVQATTWEDVAGLDAKDLAPYNTLGIDTVGRCLDALAVDIIKGDPKMGRRDGALTLQGYGSLKTRFAAWLNLMRSFGKDVVMVAHDKEDKRGDDTIVRPEITGGSYGEVFKCSDFIGYGYMRAGKRVLNFSPTEDYVGKNPAGFDLLEVPDYGDNPDYLTTLLTDIKERIGNVSARSQVVVLRVAEVREQIETITDDSGLNVMFEMLSAEDKAVQAQAWNALKKQAKALGFKFDKKDGAFAANGEGAE